MITLRCCSLAAAIGCLAAALAPTVACAASVTLKDAVNCADFKHNTDGSWRTQFASLKYGPDGKNQMNFFDTTITSKNGEIFTVLNDKCGGGH